MKNDVKSKPSATPSPDAAARAAAERKDFAEKRIEGARSPSQPRQGQQRDESGQSGAQRAAQRTQRPGEAGLANEARPGLGTRADEERDPAAAPRDDAADAANQGEPSSGNEKAGASGPQQRPVPQPSIESTRQEPQEQQPDSLAQEQQRSTGMSGQSSGV